MHSVLRTQAARASLRPAVARASHLRARTLATAPDPTLPTDGPKPSDVPKPSGGSGGGSSTLLLVVGGAAAVAGGYYYLQGGGADPHVQRKADEERVKQKAGELRDAGKATAHDAVREGQQQYEGVKASAKDKLDQARASADATVHDARAAAARQYDAAKSSVQGVAHKAEQTYEDGKHKVEKQAQSWNGWFWSWFGYTQQKADDAKREGAQKVAEGAGKVQKEAEKRA